MIFEEIDDTHDAIMLGLTHDTLMLIGWNHIRVLLVQNLAPWAGGRIICVGDYGDDLPEGVMSDQEQEGLRKLAGLSESESDGPESNVEQATSSIVRTKPTKRFNLYEIASQIFGSAEKHFRMDYRRLWRLSREEQRVFNQITKEEYQWKKGWVLMNLSKKEYVKSKVAFNILPSMQATDARCFGQLIVSRICWSTDPSCSMHFEGPIHRGVWAGDRFKIVTADVFETRTSGEEWKDVSVEATEWLKKILSAEYGYDDSEDGEGNPGPNEGGNE